MQAVEVYKVDWDDEVEYSFRGSVFSDGSTDGLEGRYFREVVENRYGRLDSLEFESRWDEIVEYLMHSFDNGYNTAVVVEVDE